MLNTFCVWTPDSGDKRSNYISPQGTLLFIIPDLYKR